MTNSKYSHVCVWACAFFIFINFYGQENSHRRRMHYVARVLLSDRLINDDKIVNVPNKS